MPADPVWLRCDPDLGAALWRTLREQLGKTVSVGGSYTSDEHVITEVWAKALDVPILRCESRYRMVGGVRDAGEHTYYLPAQREVSDAD